MTPPFQETIEKSVGTLMEERDRQQMNQMQDALIKIHSAMFDKAIAYTNLIIIAGYAATFTIWTQTKTLLEPNMQRVIAVMLIISVATFVAFETYKMISNGRIAMSLTPLIKPGLTPQHFNTLFSEHTKVASKQSLMLLPFWVATLCIAVPTGFGAGLLMVYEFIRGLFS